MKKNKIFKFNYFPNSVKNTLKLSLEGAVFVAKIAIYSKFLILMQKRGFSFLKLKLNYLE